MGTKRRPRPARLPEKLSAIRTAYDLSQGGMIRRLGLEGELLQADISAFERGTREPPLPYLLAYARAAGGAHSAELLQALIDDEAELPSKLAVDPLHGVVARSPRDEDRQLVKTSKRAAKKTSG